MSRFRATFGITCASAFVLFVHQTYANHANSKCQFPEEVFDELASSLPFELELTRLNAADGKQYIELIFKKLGGEPPFDVSKMTGMVLIHAPALGSVYSGAVDGPNGTMCHAAAIPKWLNDLVMNQIAKEKA